MTGGAPDVAGAPGAARVAAAFRLLARMPLWLLYLLTALPMAVFLALATAPMQVADEDAHFLRAVQIGAGGLRATFDGRRLNGLLPAPVIRFARGFGSLPVDGRRRAALVAAVEVADPLGWQAPRIPAFFGNTAIYPPVLYLPAALGIDLCRLLGATLPATLTVARLAQAMASLTLASLALGMARRGRVVLFVLLSLPMTLSLFGSCSQEGPMLATAACCAAWLSRRDARSPGSWRGWIGAGLLIGLLGAAKLPQMLLGLLPACVGAACGRGRTGAAATVASLLVSVGWLLAGALPAMGGLGRAGVSPQLQLAFIVAHPLRMAGVAVDTLTVLGPTLVRETIGVLGLLDTLLPVAFYAAALLCLVVACGMEGWPMQRARAGMLPGGVRLAMAAVLSGCVAAIFAILDLVWTPVGAGLIEGVQGRYLLPPLLFAILLLPRAERAVGPEQLRLAGGFALLCWCVVPATIVARYG